MKKLIFLISIFVFIFLTVTPKNIFSQDRYATCDLCGYCVGNPPPGNWEECRQCLYPNVSSKADLRESLKINPTTNTPPTPVPGNAYTTLGCVRTNLASFERRGAAKSLTQIILDFIIKIIGALSFIYLIYGSFFVITSQGDPEKLNEGKRIIVGAVIGLMFSLFSVLIINIIATQILKAPGF